MKKILFLFISLFGIAHAAMANENVLSLSSYTFEAGTTQTIYVHIDQPESFGGFQFNLYLPEGVSVILKGKDKPKLYEDGPWGDDDVTISCTKQTDGSYMFLEYLNVGADEPGPGKGFNIEMKVETSADAKIGASVVQFKNTRFSINDASVKYDDVEFPAEILDKGSGVGFNFDNSSNVTVYSASGTLICKDKKWSEVAGILAKGIYIVSGKKVVVK